MNTITCNQCGIEIEVSTALTEQLQQQIEQQVLRDAHKKHADEIAKVKAEADLAAKAAEAAAKDMADRKLAGEREVLIAKAKADAEIAEQRLKSQLENEQKKLSAQNELIIKSLRDDAESKEQSNRELRQQLTELMQNLRLEKKARENAELEAQKKLAEEETKIRQHEKQQAEETFRLKLAEQEKKLADTQKMLEEAQRKATQGSQQLQGEIMELDLERALADAWRDDAISPVPKGVNGADIAHTVRSPRGTECGLILWEIKRTKNWTDGWVPKLKEDVRNAKAAVAVIVTEAMPKDIASDMGQIQGVWVCKPRLAIVLGSLLRDSLLAVARQKALADNRGSKAEALYNFVTSHEFIHQVENMVETYGQMTLQIQKERIAYEKLWSQREKQAQALLYGTANIIGSMQGYVGQSSMLKIKGLELLDSGDGEEPQSDASGNLTLV